MHCSSLLCCDRKWAVRCAALHALLTRLGCEQ